MNIQTFKAPIRIGKKLWHLMKRRPKTSAAVILVLLLMYMGISVLRMPTPPEYLTEPATTGRLQQSVEAVGEVISETDLKLQFPITGIVEKVHVQEGDRVEAGQELARLRSSGLSADVNSAAAQVASARADLATLEQGTRPEEIAITEASVNNKRSALAAAKETLSSSERNLVLSRQKLSSLEQEAVVSLDGYVASARSDISRHTSTALTAAQVMDDVFNDNDLLDVFLKHEPGIYELARSEQLRVQTALQAVSSRSISIRDYEEALELLQEARALVSDLAGVLNQTYNAVSALPITPSFSNADREDSKADIATQRSNVQSALSSLDSALKALRDASANFDTRISAEEASVATLEGTRDRALADIRTFETSLQIEEAQLSLQRAGNRKSDIDASRGRLNQAYAQLQRAQERYSDTIITAPIAGQITQVNLKEGELLSTSFASDSAISMLGDAPYRVEMFIAEIDIPKVIISQTGALTLDAFPGQEFVLIVTELDPAATLIDGVAKYRSKLDFVGSDTSRMKIGMTGDAEIFTDVRENTVIIPGRAVITNDKGQTIVRILDENGEVEEREVHVGIDGNGGDREVISGVEEGEMVIVLIVGNN